MMITFTVKNKIGTITFNQCNYGVDVALYNEYLKIDDQYFKHEDVSKITLKGGVYSIRYMDYRKKHIYLNLIELHTDELVLENDNITILDIKKSLINQLNGNNIGSLFLKRTTINKLDVKKKVETIYIENDNTLCQFKTLGIDCITVKGQRNLIGTLDADMDCYYNKNSLLILEHK